VHGRFIRGRRRVHGACYAGCVPEHPGCAGGSSWVVPASLFPVPVNPAAEVLLPAGLGRVYGPVRGCPRDRRHGWPGARTYSVQRARRKPHEVSFPQVRDHVEVQAVAYCKTVGSAYVGSNPTPATRFRSSKAGDAGLRHRLLRGKGAVHQTVGCVLWAMRGPDPAVRQHGRARSRCLLSWSR